MKVKLCYIKTLYIYNVIDFVINPIDWPWNLTVHKQYNIQGYFVL